jgi:MFS family permease
MVEPLSQRNAFFRSKGWLLGFIMMVNFYSWFFPLYIFYEGILGNLVADRRLFEYVIGIHYLSALVLALTGASLVRKRGNRDRILYLWMALGVAASLLLGFVPIAKDLSYLYFFSFVLGSSLGLGFPLLLAYFADYNESDRGRRAGMTFFASGLGIVLVGLATALLPFIVNVAIFAAWRAVGFVVFLSVHPKERKEVRTDVTYRSILEQRSFLLYFVPWVIYCIINFSEASLLKAFFGKEFSYFVPVAEYGIGGAVAFVGGYISDLIGRKIVIAFGYATLGIGYAILGLFPYNMISWYSYVVVDSISVGIFALAFFILIWGELAADKSKEKYFLLGAMPYLILSYLGMALQPYMQFIPVTSAFSLAAFFLFLAILPLMYAPETLPEKQIKDRELRQYVEKAKQTKEKYA